MTAPKMKLLARATTRSSQPAWTELRLELAKTLKDETSKECKVQDKTLSTRGTTVRTTWRRLGSIMAAAQQVVPDCNCQI